MEEQAFIAARKPPMFDRAPAEGAVFSDLDPELVDAYVQSVRRREPEGLGKFEDQMELLRRACVTTADNVPTVAGILALGLYPQQFFPRFVIQAAAEPLQGAPVGAVPVIRPRSRGPSPACSTRRWSGRDAPSTPSSSPRRTAACTTATPTLLSPSGN